MNIWPRCVLLLLLLPMAARGDGWLGMTLHPHAQGVEIVDLALAGPAEQAGVRIGDVLVEAAGKPVANTEALVRVIAAQRDGQTLTLTLLRDGQRLSASPVIRRRPPPDPFQPMPSLPEMAGEIGRLNALRTELAPDRFKPGLTGQLTRRGGLRIDGESGRCKARAPAMVSLRAEPGDWPFDVVAYDGELNGCRFDSAPTLGLIRFRNGNYWLGAVGGDEFPVPLGLGERSLGDMVRVEELTLAPGVSKPSAQVTLQDLRLQRHLAERHTSMQTVLGRMDAHGNAADGFVGWRSGRHFRGRLQGFGPAQGVMTLPEGHRLTGVIEAGNYWRAGMLELELKSAVAGLPPGRYRLPVPAEQRIDRLPASALLAAAQPLDGETLARAGSNTRGCPAPRVVPAGWVAWWPGCVPGGEVAVYSPSGQGRLVFPARAEVPAVLEFYAAMSEGGALQQSLQAMVFTAQANVEGEGRWRDARGQLLFEGRFVANSPRDGFCPRPAEEGGGLEPCEFRDGQRVDALHHIRLQRLAARREQEAFLARQQAEARAAEAALAEARAREQPAPVSGGGFQWGKLAAMGVGAAMGGVGKLDAETQARFIGGMISDSAPGVGGVGNTQAATRQAGAPAAGAAGAADSGLPVKDFVFNYTCPGDATPRSTRWKYRTEACNERRKAYAARAMCNDMDGLGPPPTCE